MRRGKRGGGGGGGRNGLLPNSLRIISSCLRTVSSNAGSVARSAGGAVAGVIGRNGEDEKDQVGREVGRLIRGNGEDKKDQVLWAGFDKLELSSSVFKHVLLLGYSNGFQVLDVEDASDVHELVSKRDGPVTFLQMQPIPDKFEGPEGFRSSHPLLLVVAGDKTNGSGIVQGGRLSALIKDGGNEAQQGTCISAPTVVRFFSLKSYSIVHVLRFRSAVYIVRCSPRIVAVALAAQIYCFDAVTLENKFSVLTYPIQGEVGISVGYGPMALGPRWLAYAPNVPLLSNTSRLSPQNLSPSPGVSPSTSPGSGSLFARYAMESSKQLAAGILDLGDMGYKTLSKYCQDLLPDGSNSPVSPHSGRKIGKISSPVHHSDADNAGMVVIKDFVSKVVISQFRAHTSPISALCFDPSGTLLVTTSIHGNNINVFRIMPNSTLVGPNGSHSDWTYSHVHLYKLYRGITTAVIQDISFSHYSQWVSVISSRGTCHVYVLSPFGGDAGLQTQSLHGDGPVLVPNISLPWWTTSSGMIDSQFRSPPPLVTLSVISRIKNTNSGWLNTVSAVAASASGKLHVPSGAVAAIFRNSVGSNFKKAYSKAYPLEQLLVYTPSGHVVQYELLPSAGESGDSSSGTSSGSHLQIQDEELRVDAEPVQWWDVCRRLNWPERDEYLSGLALHAHDKNAEVIVDIFASDENGLKGPSSPITGICENNLVRTHEKPNWYLSNAELRSCYGRIPIWQKSKISFYTMTPPKESKISASDSAGGETEIEKIPVNEVEMRQKDLLPVFQHFHSVQQDWHDRSVAGGRYITEYSLEGGSNNMSSIGNPDNLESGIPSEQCSNVGSLQDVVGTLTNLEDSNQSKPREIFNPVAKPNYQGFTPNSVLVGHLVHEVPLENCQMKPDAQITSVNSDVCNESVPTKYSLDSNSVVEDYVLGNNFSYHNRHSNSTTIANGGVSELSDSNTTTTLQPQSICLESKIGIQEGYCKLTELDDPHDPSEAITDADSSSSHGDREKLEEDEENDILGGVFAFSEEG